MAQQLIRAVENFHQTFKKPHNFISCESFIIAYDTTTSQENPDFRVFLLPPFEEYIDPRSLNTERYLPSEKVKKSIQADLFALGLVLTEMFSDLDIMTASGHQPSIYD
jgi:hypothetical protein